MRTFVGVCSLFLVLACGQAHAQTKQPEPTKQARSEAEAQLRADWLKTCAVDWDAGTHMTRKEWHRVCQRVTDERVKFRIDQQVKDELRNKKQP